MVTTSASGSTSPPFAVAYELASRANRRDNLTTCYSSRISETVLEVPPLGIELGTFFGTLHTDLSVAARDPVWTGC